MTNELRPGLPPLPPSMAHLPIDRRGYPVPYFVAVIDGEPDHRVIAPVAIAQCVNRNLCWLCGRQLKLFKSFVLGPMCGVNRISSEPPSHLECARYAAQACPFMTRPHAKRREANLPDDRKEPAGIHLERNPGVTLLWTTQTFKPFRCGAGVLFDIGPAAAMEWYAEGRAATRDEAREAILSGLPKLLEVAALDGAAGVRELNVSAAVLLTTVDLDLAAP